MQRKIKDIAYINKDHINNNSNIKNIVYLDTGNITEGFIKGYAHYPINKAPSRAKRIVKKNDIIFSTVRPKLLHYGLLKNIPDNLIVSTGFVVLTCKDEILPGYLYSFLRLPSTINKLQSIAENSTSAYPSIKPMDVGNLYIKIPSLSIQNKIVKILSSLDNKIELNNKIIATVQNISQELYKRWFIDFEFPNEVGKPYKNSGGKMIDSELGLIPEGWEVGFIGDDFLTTILKSGINKFDSCKRYLATANVEQNKITGFSNITYYDKPSRANMQPIINSVWFSKMQGSFKNILVDESSLDLVSNYIFSTGFMGLRCNNNSIYYIWNYINNSHFQFQKDNNSTGTLMAGLSNSIMRNFKLVIPCQKVLIKYDGMLIPFYSRIINLQLENENLTNIRDLLLPKLLSGKIDLNNID